MARACPDIYKSGDELEVHFNFEVLRVFKLSLEREVDEGVRIVMHTGVLLNSINCPNNHRKKGGQNRLTSQPKDIGSPEASPQAELRSQPDPSWLAACH